MTVKLFFGGKNSKLLNGLIKRSILEKKSYDDFDIDLIDRGNFLAIEYDERFKNGWLIIFWEPKCNSIDQMLFDQAKSLFHERVILISSISAQLFLLGYKYPKRKRVREAHAQILGFKILRCATPIAFQRKQNYKNSLSPTNFVTDEYLFFQGIRDLISNECRISMAYKTEKTCFQNQTISILSKVYGLTCRALGKYRVLLRPVDLVLKTMGLTGYGYSYFEKELR